MIYAPVDVELVDHERVYGATLDLPGAEGGLVRTAMVGLFTWSLLYCRMKKRDGDVPKGLAHIVHGGGLDDVIRRLVDSGLWEDGGNVYRVRNYTAKNESREDIQARIESKREADRERARKRRTSSAPPPSPTSDLAGESPVSRDVATDVARHVARQSRDSQATPVSDSVSGSGSDLRSGSDAGARAENPDPDFGGVKLDSTRALLVPPAPSPPAEAPKSRGSTMLPPSGSPTPPPPDIPITPDLEANCAMAGWPRPTKGHVVALLAHARKTGKTSLDWPSELLSWMGREKRFGDAGGARASPPQREITSRSYGDGPTHYPEHERATPAQEREFFAKIFGVLDGASPS